MVGFWCKPSFKFVDGCLPDMILHGEERGDLSCVSSQKVTDPIYEGATLMI